MSDFVKVAQVGEIALGKGKVVEVNGQMIAVLNSGGTFYALDNFCPHKGGPLGEGTVVGNLVLCPWHCWTFDITTGKCTVNSMSPPVTCFEVKVEGDDILVRI
ncbi:MAG: Rieske (2Fe-2S) protein [Acidobacteriota bacterium]